MRIYFGGGNISPRRHQRRIVQLVRKRKGGGRLLSYYTMITFKLKFPFYFGKET